MEGLFAFWKYDQFPYLLGGNVEKVFENGLVKIKEYNSTFRPVLILPKENGEMLKAKLEDLRAEYREEQSKLRLKFELVLAILCADIGEECVYLECGEDAMLVYPGE